MQLVDDEGTPVPVPADVRRVVSLVPSLTESVAASAPGLLVGATDWCTHPPGLDVVRVRGTKNPDLEKVLDLQPDLVLANEEENRPADLATLREAGVPVWVTAPRDVESALGSLARMLHACRLPTPGWLDDAVHAWTRLSPPVSSRTAFVPIWRRPWMALGRDTFAGDVLRRLGVANLLDDSDERYPRVELATVRGARPDLVVLPDEPYAFTREEAADDFTGWQVPVAHVSGRHLTWYGPSLVEAPTVLRAQLDAAAVLP